MSIGRLFQRAPRRQSASDQQHDPARPAAGDNAFLQEQLQGGGELEERVRLLEMALSSLEGRELERDHQRRLRDIRGQLNTLRALQASGDHRAANRLLDRIDREAGRLVADSGTVVDVAPREQGAANPAFEGVSTLYVNGMTESLTASLAASQSLADVRGTEVGLVYNESRGFMPDLGEAVLQKLQHLVPGEHRTREGETLAAAIDGEMDAGNKVDVVAHSQGGNFAKEAVQRLDDTRADQQRLDQNLHLTMLGTPTDSDELPDHFRNATFLEEKDDAVSNHLGRRDRDEKRSWWERLPVIGRDLPREGHEFIEFDDPDRAWGSGAHAPSTYFGHPDAQAVLQRNPFAR